MREFGNSIKEYTESPNEDGEVVEDKKTWALTCSKITLLTDAIEQ